MATNINYTNYLDQPIDQTQIELIDKYNKIYKDDNLIKKVEFYEDKQIKSLIYYRDLETNEEILNAYSNIELIDIRTRENYGGIYTIEICRAYYNGVLDPIVEKLLKDSNGNVLCTASFNESGNQIALGSTEKYYYENDEKVLCFDYKDDGTLNYIWGDWVDNTDQRVRGSIYFDKISLYFPDLIPDNPYYLNADFLPI